MTSNSVIASDPFLRCDPPLIPLLSLLHARPTSTTDISVDICSVGCLSHQTLHSLPRLPNRGRRALVCHYRINSGGEMGDGALDKDALGISGPEEDRVDGQ